MAEYVVNNGTVHGGKYLEASEECQRTKFSTITVKLSRTKLGTLPPLVLGGIMENQNSDFVM